jgi:hypothetical protein
MAIERKIIIGLNDVKALVFECNICKSRISIPIEEAVDIASMPKKCYIGHHWNWNIAPAASSSPYAAIIQALASINAIETGDEERNKPDIATRSEFRVLMEFEDPKLEK